MAEKEYLHCIKCNRELVDTQFYMNRDGSRTDMCKKCLTMHIDPFDESTYTWLLEKLDFPFVPLEWNSLRDDAYAKNPNKANGTAIFGKYLSKMRLKQYKKFDYSQSDQACEVCRKNKGGPPQQVITPEYEKDLTEKYEAGLISKAQYQTSVSTKTAYEENNYLYPPMPDQELAAQSEFYNEDYFLKEEELPDIAENLTQEDKIYLAMKWGRLYKPDEWISLEKKYQEMNESFDIQDSDTSGTLILICKTYLKMNQAVNQE